MRNAVFLVLIEYNHNFIVEAFEHLRGVTGSDFTDYLSEFVAGNERQKGTRHTMAGTVHCSDRDQVVFTVKPVEIAADNIARTEINEALIKVLFQL